MNAILFITILGIILYLVLTAWVIYHWEKIAPLQSSCTPSPPVSISVIIAIRNESATLPTLFQYLKNLDDEDLINEYILVNDFSQDGTRHLLAQLTDPNIRVFHLEDQPGMSADKGGKKIALAYGIQQARHSWIVLTDADCKPAPGWLQGIVSYIDQYNPVCLLGPVFLDAKSTVFGWMQRLDMMGMMAYTGAGVRSGRFHMGNGGNLAFSKKAFELIEGYSGHAHKASGDDVFLVQSMAEKFHGKVHFMKTPNVLVRTNAMSSIHSFINQRIRWGGKADMFREPGMLIALGIQFLFNSWLTLTLIGIVVGWRYAGMAFLATFSTKLVLDYLLLSRIRKDFPEEKTAMLLIPAAFFHSLYICCIGLVSLVKKRYDWKGRRVT